MNHHSLHGLNQNLPLNDCSIKQGSFVLRFGAVPFPEFVSSLPTLVTWIKSNVFLLPLLLQRLTLFAVPSRPSVLESLPFLRFPSFTPSLVSPPENWGGYDGTTCGATFSSFSFEATSIHVSSFIPNREPDPQPLTHQSFAPFPVPSESSDGTSSFSRELGSTALHVPSQLQIFSSPEGVPVTLVPFPIATSPEGVDN